MLRCDWLFVVFESLCDYDALIGQIDFFSVLFYFGVFMGDSPVFP